MGSTRLCIALVLGALAIVAAACSSGGGSAGVASLGATTTTAPSTSANSLLPNPQTMYDDEIAYAACMRSHGLSAFPDPTESSHHVGFPKNPYDEKSHTYVAANTACKHLLPYNGGFPSGAQLAAIETGLLKYTKCMRANGVPDFPEPTISSHAIGFNLSGAAGVNSATMSRAQKVCRAKTGVGP